MSGLSLLPFFRGDDRGPHQKGLGGRPGALCRADASVGRGVPQAVTPQGRDPGNGRAPAHLVRQGWETSNGPTQSGYSANICQVDTDFIIPVTWCCKFLPAVHRVSGRLGLGGEWLMILRVRACQRQGELGELRAPRSVKLNASSENPGRHGPTSFLLPLGFAPLNLSRPTEDLPWKNMPWLSLGTLPGVAGRVGVGGRT